MAKLYFKYGAMNSGKSTDLLNTRYTYIKKGMKVLCFTPKFDTRSGVGKIKNRIGSECDAMTFTEETFFYEEDVRSILQEEKYGCILVDECQFLTKQQVDQLSEIVDNYDIPVICYGLKTDFTGHLFEGSKRLLEISSDITEIKTICKCGAKAIMTARFDNGIPVNKGNQIQIGDSEYDSFCHLHYKQLFKE